MTAIIRALLCVLALLALTPATASATHWRTQDPPEQAEQPWGDEEEHGWEEPTFEPAPPAPAEPPQLPPPVPDFAPPADPETWAPEPEPQIPLVATPTVAGKQAMLRTNGKAAIPRGAPQRVRAIIAAANQIVGKPYKWGGGHAKLVDRGYDCSGTVSYALIKSGTGLLYSPMVSGSFARWGAAGAGRWVTVYANRGHVYLEIAGLRLDTSAVGDWGGSKGVRWRPVIGKRKGFKVRHALGL